MNLPRILAGGVIIAVLVVAAAAAGWWFLIREDNELATNAPDIPAELVGTPASEATAGATSDASASTDARSFTIIPERSEAAYFADEQLANLPVPSTAKGSTTAVAGELHLSEDGFDLDPSKTSVFTVDVSTIKSDEDRRDSRMHEALQSSQFPTATFTATSVSGVDKSVPDGEEHSFQLTGTLDLRGVQREVTWDVKARREGDVITALGTVNFLYEDFGIPAPNIAGFVSVEDDVTLQVQIVAQAS